MSPEPARRVLHTTLREPDPTKVLVEVTERGVELVTTNDPSLDVVVLDWNVVEAIATGAPEQLPKLLANLRAETLCGGPVAKRLLDLIHLIETRAATAQAR